MAARQRGGAPPPQRKAAALGDNQGDGERWNDDVARQFYRTRIIKQALSTRFYAWPFHLTAAEARAHLCRARVTMRWRAA